VGGLGDARHGVGDGVKDELDFQFGQASVQPVAAIAEVRGPGFGLRQMSDRPGDRRPLRRSWPTGRTALPADPRRATAASGPGAFSVAVSAPVNHYALTRLTDQASNATDLAALSGWAGERADKVRRGATAPRSSPDRGTAVRLRAAPSQDQAPPPEPSRPAKQRAADVLAGLTIGAGQFLRHSRSRGSSLQLRGQREGGLPERHRPVRTEPPARQRALPAARRAPVSLPA
jgi:hypothetical protein